MIKTIVIGSSICMRSGMTKARVATNAASRRMPTDGIAAEVTFEPLPSLSWIPRLTNLKHDAEKGEAVFQRAHVQPIA